MKTSKEIDFCEKCYMQPLGDEFHALFICPFYSQVRNKKLKQCNQSKLASVFRLYDIPGP